MFEKFSLNEGVTLYIRPTSQFKTLNFSVKWKHQLTNESAAKRSVLANVLQHSNEKYPSTAALRMHLDELYGTAVYTDATKRGAVHNLSLNIECVNDQFLTEEVMPSVLNLLHDMIFKPNFENGRFKQSIVEREKQSVMTRIQSIYDDKTRYAQFRMLQILRPDHPASVTANGTLEEVEKLTVEDLMSMYEEIINRDEVDIYVVGDVDPQAFAKELEKVLPFPARKSSNPSSDLKGTDQNNEVQTVRERQEMKQGKLHIGFGTSINFKHPDYAKMQITNGVFGGYPHSKLFMNVREKESMAYYVSSSYSSHYGLVYVIAGIDADLEEKAVNLIGEQLDELKAGKITDLELSQTKALLINSLKETLDSARGQIEIYDQYKSLSEDFSVEEWVEKWSSVSKEDVQQMAETIQMELVYLLSGKEAN